LENRKDIELSTALVKLEHAQGNIISITEENIRLQLLVDQLLNGGGGEAGGGGGGGLHVRTAHYGDASGISSNGSTNSNTGDSDTGSGRGRHQRKHLQRPIFDIDESRRYDGTATSATTATTTNAGTGAVNNSGNGNKNDMQQQQHTSHYNAKVTDHASIMNSLLASPVKNNTGAGAGAGGAGTLNLEGNASAMNFSPMKRVMSPINGPRDNGRAISEVSMPLSLRGENISSAVDGAGASAGASTGASDTGSTSGASGTSASQYPLNENEKIEDLYDYKALDVNLSSGTSKLQGRLKELLRTVQEDAFQTREIRAHYQSRRTRRQQELERESKGF